MVLKGQGPGSKEQPLKEADGKAEGEGLSMYLLPGRAGPGTKWSTAKPQEDRSVGGIDL